MLNPRDRLKPIESAAREVTTEVPRITHGKSELEIKGPEQRRESIKRRGEAEETRAKIAWHYNVHPNTISRLTGIEK
jgi:hypothetical protein